MLSNYRILCGIRMISTTTKKQVDIGHIYHFVVKFPSLLQFWNIHNIESTPCCYAKYVFDKVNADRARVRYWMQ